MKTANKIATLFFLSVFLIGFVSCNKSEINTPENNSQSQGKIIKTPEMKSFETALQIWMVNHSNTNMEASAKTAGNHEMETAAKNMLSSIGVSETEIASKAAISTDMLVSVSLQKYSEKLTAMYNEQKN